MPTNIWSEFADGSETHFYSCGICGASVQPQDRDKHVQWHDRLQKLTNFVRIFKKTPSLTKR